MDSKVAVNVRAGGGGGARADVWKRGTKRSASDSNLSDQSFEYFQKRLRMLSLRESRITRLSNDHESNGTHSDSSNQDRDSHLYTPVSNAPSSALPNGLSHVQCQSQDEHMQLDDTNNRVYIHDLDAELADIESDEEKLIFLPDIEKHFSKIPQQVLAGGHAQDNQELVLYSVPKSLSMDEGHDSVRKAIIESRQRARDKAIEDARQADMDRKYGQGEGLASLETAHGYTSGYEEEPDPDAMDLG